MKIKEIRRFRHAIRLFDRLHSNQMKDCCSAVTPAQCHFLMELEEHAPITSGELAAILSIDASTLTRTGDRLVEKKLIVREPHPEDRRSLLICLTPQGQIVCDDINRENDAQSRKVFAKIPAKLQLSVLRDFEMLVEAMQKSQLSTDGTKCCD